MNLYNINGELRLFYKKLLFLTALLLLASIYASFIYLISILKKTDNLSHKIIFGVLSTIVIIAAHKIHNLIMGDDKRHRHLQKKKSIFQNALIITIIIVALECFKSISRNVYQNCIDGKISYVVLAFVALFLYKFLQKILTEGKIQLMRMDSGKDREKFSAHSIFLKLLPVVISAIILASINQILKKYDAFAALDFDLSVQIGGEKIVFFQNKKMFFLLLLFDLIFYVILNHVINKEENKNRNLGEDVAKASLLAIGITISGTALATINSIENKNNLRVSAFLRLRKSKKV